jgi:uncharacterized SAM-binding protein YcdF (DUF218 family)
MRWLRRIKLWVLTPFLTALLIALSLVDIVAVLLDRTLHTRFRAPKITVEEIDQLIATELPTGLSYAQLLAFLEAHRFRHLPELHDVPELGRHVPPDDKLEANRDQIKKMMVATVENVGRYIMVRHDIMIRFYVDAENDLVEFSTEVYGIGL